ncbi:MAG TPA: hypothetical protein VEC35_18535 [Noviherbaspirillum sp.]|nr:hypothetical protein [Noviherbaspirillum sp.]
MMIPPHNNSQPPLPSVPPHGNQATPGRGRPTERRKPEPTDRTGSIYADTRSTASRMGAARNLATGANHRDNPQSPVLSGDLADVAPPPGLQSAALRLLNPAAHIPDDVGLISYGTYEASLRAAVARLDAQGVPIRMAELEPEPGKPPILHIWAGNGANHHLSLSGVHSNETHSMLADLAEIEAVGRRPNLLQELGITWHWLHLDPEGTILSEKGLKDQPDPHRYASGVYRTLRPEKQAAWGFPSTAADCTFNGPLMRGVRALMSVVGQIYAEDRQQVISIRHGHNSHLDRSQAAFYLPEPHLKKLSQPIEAAAEARGLVLLDTLAESDSQIKAPGTKATFTAFPANEIFEIGGGNDPERYIAEVAGQHGKQLPVSAVFEPVKWGQGTPNPELRGLTSEQAAQIANTTLGNIPSLNARAEQVLSDFVRDNPAALEDPLVEGALSAARWDLQHDRNSSWMGEAAEPRTLSHADAFMTTVTLPFYRAGRVGQVARGLEQCRLDAQLQKELRGEMHRVVNETLARGNIQPVPVDNAVRAMIDIGLLTLDHAIALHRQDT